MILVDTNVLLDVATDDPVWGDWSQHQLNAASSADRLAINPVVYAEFASSFARVEDLDAMLALTGIAVIEMSRPALFLAGQAFKTYRSRGGMRQYPARFLHRRAGSRSRRAADHPRHPALSLLFLDYRVDCPRGGTLRCAPSSARAREAAAFGWHGSRGFATRQPSEQTGAR